MGVGGTVGSGMRDMPSRADHPVRPEREKPTRRARFGLTSGVNRTVILGAQL